MPDGAIILDAIDIVAREASLFACAGFLIGGLDDVAIDLIYAGQKLHERVRRGRAGPRSIEELGAPAIGRIALFVPAWDEAKVIGPMLRTALSRFGDTDFCIYVGTYPNDRPTIDAVAAVAREDGRVRLVIGELPGPTTKADCLNGLWRALLRDVHAGEVTPLAIVLHDAEDVVHREELRVYTAMLRDHDLVQIPVLPLIHRGSRMIAGHYADEFAESHAKTLTVRCALGAALPLAGVGCAIRYDMLSRVAETKDGIPFDAASLTEDYELGLAIKKFGGRPVFAAVAERRNGPPVAVRAYFPDKLDAAVRQKARWMIGIALAGWDRVGWSALSDLPEHWMRMRDRRALIAVLVLAAAYIAVLAGGLSLIGHMIASTHPLPDTRVPQQLLTITFFLLLWRLAMRAWFTGRAYGWVEGMLAVPRAVVGNVIGLMAARRAVTRYIGMLMGRPLRWDKTRHQFPDSPDRAGA